MGCYNSKLEVNTGKRIVNDSERVKEQRSGQVTDAMIVIKSAFMVNEPHRNILYRSYSSNGRMGLLVAAMLMTSVSEPGNFDTDPNSHTWYSENGLSDKAVSLMGYMIIGAITVIGLSGNAFGIPDGMCQLANDTLDIAIKLAESTCFKPDSDFDYVVGFTIDNIHGLSFWEIYSNNDFKKQNNEDYYPVFGISCDGDGEKAYHGTKTIHDYTIVIA
ncbi:hypothetical protein BB559_006076 [Furculomyces boomerangus]|uniref:Uncharacterized protein n=2 Tax=Harpellales TaxID=61421 RepID=A0A2T9Y516_9FUNG|nr:hypothetical protein BB559_006076 [Furculomyces boomerangus]PWA00058.1 hypothetical protein BB558_003952 [Smittium angustum]PWA02501.1 hypothetical protein BB558_001304 [Smittium angustum]